MIGLRKLVGNNPSTSVTFINGKSTSGVNENPWRDPYLMMYPETYSLGESVIDFLEMRIDHIDEIIDSTDCGYAFQAAFVIEWFTSKDVKSAMLQGSLATCKVLSFMGGVE